LVVDGCVEAVVGGFPPFWPGIESLV
jgi:hypothetical protein